MTHRNVISRRVFSKHGKIFLNDKPRGIMRVSDLVSTAEDTAKAFALQALRKTDLATYYLDAADTFEFKLSRLGNLNDIVNNEDIRGELLTSVGISDKAKKYFTSETAKSYLEEIVKKIDSQSPENLKVDLVNRFLLTSGDSMGGRSRNLIGREGGERLIQFVKEALEGKKIHYEVSSNAQEKTTAITWQGRIMLFDVKPSWIGKNIDVILLRDSKDAGSPEVRENPEMFLACGEIKGGADPAGSDEHWKTARSALDRISAAFKEEYAKPPKLFFAGLSIVPGVAKEIVEHLDNGKLNKAANLARSRQVADLAEWLISL